MNDREICGWLLVVGLALIIFGSLAAKALGHEWYPALCCGGSECRPVPCGNISPSHGGIRYEPKSIAEQTRSKGNTAWYFEHDQIRESPDGQCHVCTLYMGAWAYNMRRGMCAFIPNVGY